MHVDRAHRLARRRLSRPATAAAYLSDFAILTRCALILLAVMLLASSLGASTGMAARAAEPVVNSVRFGHHGDRTRVVLEIDHDVAFNTMALSDPTRLLVDLPAVDWQVMSHPLGSPRGLVSDHHYEDYADDRSRLVVEVTEPFEIVDQFTLPPSSGIERHRLVIDLAALDADEVGGASAAQGRRDRSPGQPPTAQPSATSLPQVSTTSLPQVPDEVRPPAPRPEPNRVARRPVIVIDPGHGGLDPGAIGANGLEEADIVLAMATILRAELASNDRYDVVMTRTRDEYVPLRERIQIARRARGDLFISIHADSLDDPRLKGASVYTISENASDDEAARLAAKENKADVLSDTDLSHQDPMVAGILLDLAFRDTTNKSIEFADRLVGELADVTELIRRHRRFAGFVVLKSPDVPSVLVELGFLSNRENAKKLADPAYQRRLAKAIRQAIDTHFDTPQ